MPVTPAKIRKQAERAKKKAMGITTVSSQLSSSQLTQLNELCSAFGDNTGDYSHCEMISTLITKAHAQSAKLPTCTHCKLKLPKGCNGTFKGESKCQKKYLSQTPIKLM